MTHYVVPKIVEYLVGEKKYDALFVKEFFEYRAIGIKCYLKNDELGVVFGYYDKWDDITRDIWCELNKKDVKTPLETKNRLGVILRMLFKKDALLFTDNDYTDEQEQKMACWAALKVSLELFALDMRRYLIEQKGIKWRDELIKNSNEEAVAYLKHLTHRAIATFMTISIIVGKVEDSYAICDMLVQEPIGLPSYDYNTHTVFERSYVTSRRCQILFGEYFADELGMILSSTVKTGNNYIDKLHTNKMRGFVEGL